MKRRNLLIGGLAVPAFVAAPAWAQSGWPNKPVKIVHGFGPGGPVDLLARLVAAQFPERFGQQAIVEGKPGAGGTLGAGNVAQSAPDGYTLFLMASGHAAAPGLYPSLPFDPVNDFTVISMVARSPFAIIANPQAPYKNIQELVRQAQASPQGLIYGSAGVGTGMHLAAVLMQSRLGMKLTHVAYRGGGALNTAVIGGEVPFIFTSLAGMGPLLESGRLRALAVTSRNRFPGLPDIPTVAETVLPDFDVSAWYALAGPKGLPAPMVNSLNELVRTAIARPDIAEGIRAQAAIPWAAPAAESQAFVAKEVAHWTQVIRAEKITAPA